MGQHIFISHTSINDAFVKRLREALELFDELTWVDSRELTGGNELKSTIEESISTARYFLVVISIDALSSEWVQDELDFALKQVKKRDDGFKVISVILPGVKPGILKKFFPKEPVHIFIEDKPTGFSEAMPKIFAALGKELPNDWESATEVKAEPVEELILELTDPIIEEKDGIRRATATAVLTCNPSDNSRAIESKRYHFHCAAGSRGVGRDPLVYREVLSVAHRRVQNARRENRKSAA